jgi:hypothetical protein
MRSYVAIGISCLALGFAIAAFLVALTHGSPHSGVPDWISP